MNKLFRRWIRRRHDSPQTLASEAVHRGARHSTRHDCFKSPAGRGPFLPSCDGRVIPLRKAQFLRRHR